MSTRLSFSDFVRTSLDVAPLFDRPHGTPSDQHHMLKEIWRNIETPEWREPQTFSEFLDTDIRDSYIVSDPNLRLDSYTGELFGFFHGFGVPHKFWEMYEAALTRRSWE
jgi:hypothetical protein